MKYYKAKYDIYDLVKGELVTPYERKNVKRFRRFSDKVFDIVEISKHKTIMSFGVRKEYRA